MFMDLLFIGATDLSLLRTLGNKARWFQLHTMINMIITIMTLQDTVLAFKDPIFAMTQYCDRTASILAFSLHLYHLMVFKKLTKMDYIHHFASSFIGGGPAILFYYNKLLNACNFFICGLPGLIDYACLTAVKHNKMNRLTEKKINSFLNIYLRQPGMLYVLFMNYICFRYNHDKYTHKWINFIGPPILFWNANFFSYEAVYNYGLNNR